MTPEFVVTFAQETIKMTLLLLLPILTVGLSVGLFISIFQAVTQIQEMTLTFVPKILAMLLGLMFFGSWMLQKITQFAVNIIEQIPYYIR